mgnify:CR=1 FL=1
MGFFDAFRKKRISTPEELLERIREIERRMDEEEQRLAQDVERRLKSRFDRFWRFEEQLVRAQLTRIEDLFHLGSEATPGSNGSPPKDEAGDLVPVEADSSSSSESEPEPALGADDMKWVRTILWQVWRRYEGNCFGCRGEKELHFVPGHEEPQETDEPSLVLTPDTDVGQDPAPTAEGEPGGDAAEPVEPPIDESMTRQIIARLRLSCIECASRTDEQVTSA